MRMAALTLLAALAVGAGCASIPVRTEIAATGDLSRANTFAMAEPAEPEKAAARPDAALVDRIRTEIAEQLGERGYLVAPAEYADLSVAFEWTGETSGKRVNAGDPDADFYIADTEVQTTLAIEIADARSGAPLWRGVGRSAVQPTGRLVTTSVEDAALASVREVLGALPQAPSPR